MATRNLISAIVAAVLLGALFVPLTAVLVEADGGSLEDAAGNGPYFVSNPPATVGAKTLDLMIPWSQAAEVPNSDQAPGYHLAALTLPASLRLGTDVTAQVTGAALCGAAQRGPAEVPNPGDPPASLEPVSSTECATLTESDPCTLSLLTPNQFCARLPGATGDPASFPATNTVVVELGARRNQADLKVTLSLAGRATAGPSEAITIRLHGAWAPGTPSAQEDASFLYLPVTLAILTAPNQPRETADAPHALAFGLTREFHSFGFGPDGEALGPISATWAVVGACGTVLAGPATTTTFTATAESDLEDNCHVQATAAGPTSDDTGPIAVSNALNCLSTESLQVCVDRRVQEARDTLLQALDCNPGEEPEDCVDRKVQEAQDEALETLGCTEDEEAEDCVDRKAEEAVGDAEDAVRQQLGCQPQETTQDCADRRIQEELEAAEDEVRDELNCADQETNQQCIERNVQEAQDELLGELGCNEGEAPDACVARLLEEALPDRLAIVDANGVEVGALSLNVGDAVPLHLALLNDDGSIAVQAGVASWSVVSLTGEPCGDFVKQLTDADTNVTFVATDSSNLTDGCKVRASLPGNADGEVPDLQDDTGVITTRGGLDHIHITPTSATLTVGQTQQFTATGHDASHNTVAMTPAWRKFGSGSVSGTGLYTAHTVPGTDAVEARSGTVSETAEITINAGALNHIHITPTSATLTVGGSQQFTASRHDFYHNDLAGSVAWTVDAGGVGSIDGSGLYSAGTAPGTATVRATSAAVFATAGVAVNAGALDHIDVTPSSVSLTVGGSQAFTAVRRDFYGNDLGGSVTWSVSGVGSINPISGDYSAGNAPGTANIRATSGSVVGEASVIVNAGILDHIHITPPSATLTVGGSQAFSAALHDSFHNVLSGTVGWSVDAGGVGAIDPVTGEYSAGETPGSATVRATSASISEPASVTVNPGALDHIHVVPDSVTLTVGGSQAFTAQRHDSFHNLLTGSVTWSVDLGGVGTVDATGGYSAGSSPGSATVRATSGAVSGTASVTVNAGALDHIHVSPPSATLTVGGSQAFSAIVHDSFHNVLSGTVAWSVDAGGVGSIDGATGAYSAGTTPGAATVNATSGSIFATADVTVSAGALDHIDVTPSSATLTVGDSQAFTAIRRDSYGNDLGGSVTWSVVGVGSINAVSGAYSAGSTPGSATVRATSGSVVGEAPVTVSAGALDHIDVTPPSATLTVGGSQAFTAVRRDSFGNDLGGSVTWSVDSGGVGTIDAAGLYSAGTAPGAATVNATSGSKYSTADVTVNAGSLDHIHVVPDSVTLTVGGSQAFTAQRHDSFHNLLTGSVTWSVDLGGVGTIDATGAYSAGSTPGSATVRATSGAFSGTASVTIGAGALDHVHVSPSSATLTVGGSQTFTATRHDSFHNDLAGSVAWTVDAGGVGAIDSATGAYSAGETPGTATVRATTDALSATAGVTVNAGALDHIHVMPDPATVTVGGSQTFTAERHDSFHNLLTGSVSWSVDAGGVGSINSATGAYTASNTPGSATVRAASGAVSGTAAASVVAGGLDHVHVAPDSATLTVGGSQAFTAARHDSLHNDLGGFVTWIVDVGGVGSITSAGVYSAGETPGSATVRATSNTVSATAAVTVNPGSLDHIHVTPPSATLTVGGSQAFSFERHDSFHNDLAGGVTWSVDAAGVGTIDGTGLYSAGSTPGSATVRATSGLVSGTASVTVDAGTLSHIHVTPDSASVAAGATQAFGAALHDSFHNALTGSVSWSVDAGGVGSIDAGTGLYTASTSTGTATVRATSGGTEGTADVTVVAAALHHFHPTCDSPVAAGGTSSCSATAHDAFHNARSDPPTWSAGAGGFTPGTGLSTTYSAPGTTGTYTITAASGAAQGLTSITVQPGAMASITLNLASGATAEISADSPTQQVIATARDGSNNLVSAGSTIHWTLIDPGTANSGGSLSAASSLTDSNGQATVNILATTTPGDDYQVKAENAPADATVTRTSGIWTVVPGAPASMDVTCVGTCTTAGSPITVRLTAKDGSGNTLATGSTTFQDDKVVTFSGPSAAPDGTVPTCNDKLTVPRTIGTATTLTFAAGVAQTSCALYRAQTVDLNAAHNTGTLTINDASPLSVTVDPAAADHIDVLPTSATLSVTETQQFTSSVEDTYDNVRSDPVTWSVLAGGVGTIGPATGLYDAGTDDGTATARASAAGLFSDAAVTVTPADLDHIHVTPSPATVTVGTTQTFTAARHDVFHNDLGGTVAWSVDTGGVGAINAATGVYSAGSLPGDATVNATSEGVFGTADATVPAGALDHIHVTPATATVTVGTTEAFSFARHDSFHNDLGGTVTWSVDAGGKGSIDATGLYSAGSTPGDATVNASSGAVYATAAVTVPTAALDHIHITPASATVTVGTTQAFSFERHDSFHNNLGGTVTWSVDAGGRGSIDSAGLYSAGSLPGAATVNATSGSIYATAAVTVPAGALDHIHVAPSSATLTVGTTQAFTFLRHDSFHNDLGGSVSWSVDAGGVGSIDAAGTYTAGTLPGSATVNATSGAIFATASVTVDRGALHHIHVTPASPTVTVGTTQTFAFERHDVFHNDLGGTVTWSVDSGGSGTIDAAGVFSAASTPGPATVRATSGTISGTAAVTVAAGALEHIHVTPTSAILTVGETQAFAFERHDVFHNDLGGSVTWTVDAGGVGTIASTGLYSAGEDPGPATVRAESLGISQTATVTVNAGGLDHIHVTPDPSTVTVGGTQQFSFERHDVFHNNIGGTVTWQVDAGGAGTIHALTGLYTAGSTPGTATVRAHSGGLSGTAGVTVNAGALDHVHVSPTSASLTVGGTQAFTATRHDSFHNDLGGTVAWSVDAGGVGSIGAATGIYSAGQAPGAATVRATSDSLSAAAAVTVSAGALDHVHVTPDSVTLTVGGSQAFTSLRHDSFHNDLAGSVTWSVDTGGVGSIDSSGSYLAGSSPGTATVRATSGSVSGTASVTVNAGALDHIHVTPSSASLTVGGSQTFTATRHDSLHNDLGGSVAWAVDAGGVGSIVPATGVYSTGETPGAATVNATSGSVYATASVTVNAGALEHIHVSPDPATLTVGGSQTFTALRHDSFHNELTGSVAWSVDTGGVGSIGSGTGAYSAGSTPGSATVRAMSGSVSGTASVTVDAGALDHIHVSPSSAALTVGGSQAFTATRHDSLHNDLGGSVTWSVDTGGVGSVDAAGLYSAGETPGAATVRASSSGVESTSSVTISAGALDHIHVAPSSASLTVGASQAFTAERHDSFHNQLTGTVTWSVDTGGAGSVDAAGSYSAGSTPGTATVRATSGSVSGTASVTVNAGALDHIHVSPSSAALTVGGTQTFAATRHDSLHNDLGGSVAWSVDAGGVGTIGAANGIYSAGETPGAAIVNATSGSVYATASVTVDAGALDHIHVSPDPVTVTVGGSQSFAAARHDSFHNALAGTVTWTVDTGGVGSIDSAGSYSAGSSPGTATVRATSATISGTASVTVNAGALDHVHVSPSTASLTVGGSQAFAATRHDSLHNDLGGSVAWAVDAGGVGSIGAATGIYSAEGTPGGATVNATSGSVYATASVTVNAGALDHIHVSPDPATLTVGGSQAFTALRHDSFHNVLTGSVTWSVDTAGVGTIDAAGLYSAGSSPGSATVRATSGAVSGTASVTVNAGGLDHIHVSPSSAALTVGGSQAFAATRHDSLHNDLGGTVTWSVDTGGAGTIDAAGLYSAGETPGAATVRASSSGVESTSSVTISAGALDHIHVSPATASLTVGGSQVFTAERHDSFHNGLTGTVTWSVDTGGVGSIDAAGSYSTGSSPGTATVRATSGAVSGTASVTVNAGSLNHIHVAPSSASLTVGGSQTFTATRHDSLHNDLGGSVAWAVDAGGVGTIGAANGIYSAGETPGAATVNATSGSVYATASVTVNAGALDHIHVSPDPVTLTVGGSQGFTALRHDSFHNGLTGTVTWTVDTGGVGTIDAAGSYSAGSSPGSATVRATSATISGTAAVTVNAGGLDHIHVSPASAALTVGGSQAFAATRHDSLHNDLGGSVTWSVDTGGVGSVDASTGAYSAGGTPGGATVNATSGSVYATAAVAVSAGGLEHIHVAPSSASLTVGGSQTFTVERHDSFHNGLTGTVTWTVDTGGVGTIDAAGSYSAGSLPGTATARATSGAISGTASVTVNAGGLDHIHVTPSSAALTVGGSQAFAATRHDSLHNDLGGSVAWSVDTGGVGAIGAATGIYSAEGTPGGATVNATSGSVYATASVTVSAGALEHIHVSPDPATLTVGGSQAFTALRHDSFHNVLTGSVTWSVAGGVGSIDAGTGLYSAGSTPGSATVLATSGSVSGSAAVTVNAGGLDHIHVSPSSATLTVGGSQAFTATRHDSLHNDLGGTVTWSVDTGGVGTIDAAGLYSAGQTPGTATARAASSGVEATSSVTVDAGALDHIHASPDPATVTVGTTQAFAALRHDSFHNELTGSVSWSVDTGGAGSINSASGLYSASSTPGSATVRAASGSVSGTASVTVAAGALDHIHVSPSSVTLAAGASQTFAATRHDTLHNDLGGSVGWSVDAGGVGSIDAGTGLYSAGETPGVATVNATSGPVYATAAVTVTVGALEHIHVTPATATLAVGASQAFAATRHDSFHNDLGGSVTWSVDSGGVGSIDGTTGAYSAGSTPGSATVRATSGSVFGTAAVTVNAGTLEHIHVTPDPASIAAGSTQAFSAALHDSFHNALTGTVAWSVDAGGVGSIDSFSGLYTAPTATGTATVNATSGSVFDTAAVDIVAAALDHFHPTCASPVGAGSTSACSATAHDAFHNARTDVPTWSATAGGFTPGTGASTTYSAPGTTGTYTITAANGAAEGTTSITVQPGTLASITLNLAFASTAEISADTPTQQVVATGRDGSGNLVGAGVRIYWTLSDPDGGNTGGSLSAAFSDTDASGQATVNIVATTVPGDNYRVRADDAATDPTVTRTSGIWTVVPGAPASIDVTCVGTCTTAGSAITVRLTVKDTNGNTLNTGGNVFSGDKAVTMSGPTAAPDTTVPTCNDKVPAAVAIGTATTLNFVAGVVDTSCTLYRAQTVDLNAAHDPGTGAINDATPLSVTVDPATADHIDVTPTSAELTVTQTQQFTAVVEDTYDNARTDTVTWSVLAGGKGTINAATGLYDSGIVQGTATVNATSGALFTNAAVTVNPDVLEHIHVTPPAVTLTVPADQTFTFVRHDQYHNDLGGTVTWSVDTGGVGSIVAGTGVYSTGTVSGTATVRATSGSVSGTAAVTADPAAANHIDFISSPTASVFAGACTQYTVQVQDEFHNAQPSGAMSIALSGAMAGAFYADSANCTAQTNAITTVGKADGTSTASFFFRDNTAQLVTLDAASGALTSGTQGVTVFPAVAADFLLTCQAGCTPEAGDSVAVRLTARDAFTNTLSSGANVYGGPRSITFGGAFPAPAGNAPTCASTTLGTVASVTFTAGVADVTCLFYKEETVLLTATDTGISQASNLAITVAPDAATLLRMTIGPNEAFDAATGLNTGSPATQTAGAGFTVTMRALDVYRNVVGSGTNNYDGPKPLVFSGATNAWDGTPRTARNNTNVDVAFGGTTNVTFTNGVGSSLLTLFKKETVADLAVTDTAISGTEASFSVVAGTSTQLGMLTCSPTGDNRGCILQSESVITDPGLTTTVGADSTLRGGQFDDWDNLIASTVTVTWSSTGVSPALSGAASGVIFTPDTADDGTISVAKTGFVGRTMNVVVNA